MNADDSFYKYWFNGFNDFLFNENKESCDRLLSYCANKCSESYSLSLYKKAFNENSTIETALTYLKGSFKDFDYRIFPDKIEIIYRSCGCNLHIDGLVKSSKLCFCSEKSLKTNWSEIFGIENVEVKNVCSILRKNNVCLFEVRVKQLGHIL